MANNKTRWEHKDPPNTLLAIDPGASFPSKNPKSRVPYAGAALFQWGELCWAQLVKCPVMVDNVLVAPYARPNMLVRTVCAAARIARHDGTVGVKKGARTHVGGDTSLGEALTVLAVEKPRIYAGGEARPEDIIALAVIFGAFVGGIDAEFYAGPHAAEWKGSIKGKDIVNERTLQVLNSTERMILVAAQRAGDAGLSDHVLDAVGIGLVTMGRMGVGGVV